MAAEVGWTWSNAFSWTLFCVSLSYGCIYNLRQYKRTIVVVWSSWDYVSSCFVYSWFHHSIILCLGYIDCTFTSSKLDFMVFVGRSMVIALFWCWSQIILWLSLITLWPKYTKRRGRKEEATETMETKWRSIYGSSLKWSQLSHL